MALAAFPCLSSEGPESIRSSAESLFERLLFLDGDGVWLLLVQALDAAGIRDQSVRRDRVVAPGKGRRGEMPSVVNSGAMAGKREEPGTEYTAAREGSRGAPLGVDRGRGRGDMGYEEVKKSCAELGTAQWWESFAPIPRPPSGVLGLVRERPCVPLELGSVMVGSVVRECAQGAARLLTLLNSERVAEHM